MDWFRAIIFTATPKPDGEESHEKVGVGSESTPTKVGVGVASTTKGWVWVSCPKCGVVIKSQGTHGHFQNAHPKLNYDEWKSKFTPAAEPGTTKMDKATEDKRKDTCARTSVFYKFNIHITSVDCKKGLNNFHLHTHK